MKHSGTIWITTPISIVYICLVSQLKSYFCETFVQNITPNINIFKIGYTCIVALADNSITNSDHIPYFSPVAVWYWHFCTIHIKQNRVISIQILLSFDYIHYTYWTVKMQYFNLIFYIFLFVLCNRDLISR